MFPLTNFLQISLFIFAVVAVAIALMLILITVPKTAYSAKLANTKNIMAACYIASAVTVGFTLLHAGDVWDFNYFSAMMLLVVTSVSAGALSYSLINLVEENFLRQSTFLINMMFVCIVAILLARVFLMGPSKFLNAIVVVAVILQIIQCLVHILCFDRVLRRAKDKLADYYDEFEDSRLKWIKFAYIIMMLTELFVFVYIGLPVLIGRHVGTFMAVYALWITLFTIYFTSNFVSFLGSHKLLLDAFAHSTFTGESTFWKNVFSKIKKDDAPAGSQLAETSLSKANERQLARLEKNLALWVEEKKYREYDKSRQEIADELKTTKEIFLLYFNVKVGEDFRTWRTRLRIEDAKNLLLEERGTSISAIAERCGFSDRSNFHKQFTAIVGCSPKAYRDSNPSIEV